MKKRLLLLSLAASLLASAPLSAMAANGYSDVKTGDWFYKAVSAMSEKGIISGNPDGSFKPEDAVTYGEFIAMAVKASTGKELPAAEAPEHWSKTYYDQALESGYFTKSDISATALDIPIPRAYMALICSSILGEGAEVKGEYFDLLESSVSDVSANTKYQYEIIRSYGAGILSGYPNGTFRPEGTLNRAEAAAVIQHLADESTRSLPNIEELKEKNSDAQIAGTIEERVKAYLAGNTPPISFDPAVDTTKNTNNHIVMKEEKAREYLDRVLASLKFYGSGGKYYMTVTFPEVPDEYQIQFGADIAYKQALMKPQWGVNTSEPLVEAAKEWHIQNHGTVTRQITGMESLNQLYTVNVGMSVNRIDDTDDGSTEMSYQLQRSFREGYSDSFAINRQSNSATTENYSYDLNRHFAWN